jgi:sugar-specific transcriptional regulator TrmB
MLLQDGDIRLLLQIGFTETQAKLYLSLINTGKTDAKTLSKHANVPRQATYRTLGELQEKGIVERIIALPQKYEAVPIQDGLSIILGQKAKEYDRTVEKTKEFLLKFSTQKETCANEQEYKISIVEGKETIIKKTRYALDNTQQSGTCYTTLQRWAQVNQEIFENIKKALDRGVRFRYVIERPYGEICLPKGVKSLLAKPNYEVRLTHSHLKANVAIFDNKEASFSFYPSKALAESPMIWTNHPSILTAFQSYFENTWATAHEWKHNTSSKK